MKLNEQQIMTICKGDEEIAVYFRALVKTVADQAKHIEKLEKRVHELERQLGQNSTNSSKPPSSDGIRKPTNLRAPGGKKGAPKGHKGFTLHQVAEPDEIVIHRVSSCSHCQAALDSAPRIAFERRQVFDLPAPRVVVTEHRAECKFCPSCNAKQQAAFPERVTAPVQYGDGFASWTAYLNTYNMLPLERIAQRSDNMIVTNQSTNVLRLDRVSPKRSHIALSTANYGHCACPCEGYYPFPLTRQFCSADETMLRIEGKGHCLHTVSDDQWSLLGIHEKRGRDGILHCYFFR
ncbi:DUF6444 domain-containing protein [Paenibacillus tyrfis]|uniref:DUF6444 domain-containing protein n=1 Tax=Paenibacillus tyrfis TaxID=1501230 RepID=UPI000B58B3AB|nr:DUF6444 domain-containing protein [Paenibacillus tyrfis]